MKNYEKIRNILFYVLIGVSCIWLLVSFMPFLEGLVEAVSVEMTGRGIEMVFENGGAIYPWKWLGDRAYRTFCFCILPLDFFVITEIYKWYKEN